METVSSSGAERAASRGGSPQAKGQRAAVERRRVLTDTVELDVIPRLLLRARTTPMARSLAVPERPAAVVRLPTEADVTALADLVLTQDQREASAFVAELQHQGLPTEALYLELLTPTARRLGELWEQDLCHFTDVTIGLGRLRQVLHQSSVVPDSRRGARPTAAGAPPAALLVPMPGEQHSFGLAMVVEFFRRAGWSVWSGCLDTNADLSRMVSRQWFGMVGLSAAQGDDLAPLSRAIRRIRGASRNPRVAVMVGGPAFIGHPELAATIGADGTASDGRQAVLAAELLLGDRSGTA